MEYTFRKADKKDLAEVILLYQEAISNLIANNILQWDEIYPNEEVLSEDIELGEMYLLMRDQVIAACVVLNEDPDDAYETAPWQFTEGEVAIIHRVCVHPRFQGEGNGKRTMKFAEEELRRLGYKNIRLDAYSDNLISRSMYEKLGYSYVSEVTYRKGLFYLLEKSLA